MSTVDEQHQAAEREWLTAWLVGPTRIRLNNLPPQIGDPAPDFELPDTMGKRRRLSEFWQRVRRSSCSSGTSAAAVLRSDRRG